MTPDETRYDPAPMLDTLMSVDEAIFTRRTCRKFRKDPVSEEDPHQDH